VNPLLATELPPEFWKENREAVTVNRIAAAVLKRDCNAVAACRVAARASLS
jgi:hypothetical protein